MQFPLLSVHSKGKEMNVKKLHELAQVPQYQSAGAAGFDFHSVIEIVIMPGETEIIPTGLAFQIPEGQEIQVRPRSGMSAKTKIRVANSPGTIDSDFQGEVKIILDNTGVTPYTVRVGDRIAQGVLANVSRAIFDVVGEFDIVTERGEKGFGSSGV
jgi:dUTP pyrophosphatase